MNNKEIVELKIFLKKIIIFSVLLGIPLSIVLFVIPFEENNYYLALNDKHKALETTPQPRIILVGGSNLAFGIDSERMEKELNVSVVNTGLAAGMGLPYMLKDVKPYLKEGDTVILIPEYSLYFDGIGDAQVEPLAALIGLNPLSVMYLDQKSLMKLHVIALRLFRHKAEFAWETAKSDFQSVINAKDEKNALPPETDPRLPKNFTYSRYGFNTRGDEVSHFNYENKNNYTKYPYLDETINYDLLNEFNEYAENRNISVYVSFSPIDQNDYQKNSEAFDQFYQSLKGNVSIKILGNPEEFTYPETFFFNSQYHLNYQGAENRTEQLIFEIRNNSVVV